MVFIQCYLYTELAPSNGILGGSVYSIGILSGSVKDFIRVPIEHLLRRDMTFLGFGLINKTMMKHKNWIQLTVLLSSSLRSIFIFRSLQMFRGEPREKI